MGWRDESDRVKHLREMKPGERLVIYHTGDEKSAVGTATVVSVDPSDPKNPAVKIKVGKAHCEAGDAGRGQSQARCSPTRRWFGRAGCRSCRIGHTTRAQLQSSLDRRITDRVTDPSDFHETSMNRRRRNLNQHCTSIAEHIY